MKEFDRCPRCNEDLLLEDPDSQDKGLRCLGCGYTCQATEASPDVLLTSKKMEKLAYWQSRCKAAEGVIESIETKNDEMFATVQQVWLAIKEEGEPA